MSDPRQIESALLGAVLRKPVIYSDLAGMLSKDDFSWQPYGEAWQMFGELSAAGMRIDQLTVGDALERKNQINEFILHDTAQYSGRAALSTLRDSGDPASAADYAELVVDYSAKRKMEATAGKLAYWAKNGRRAADIAADITQELSNIRTPNALKSASVTMKEAIRQAYDHTYKAAGGEVSFLELGYPDLDKIIDGIMPSDFWVLAGRPGDGKTALLGSIAKNIAESKKRVMFFTLEMAAQQLAMRFLAMESGVTFGKQKRGALTADEWERYNAAVEKLGDENYPVSFCDMPDITPAIIRRELRKGGKFDLILFDYIQLAAADGQYDNRVLEVGAITRSIKLIAKEFGVPVIAAAQLSRKAEERGDNPPRLSDLRESGSIEQDSDGVIFIHRPDRSSATANIVVAKNRNGPTSQCQLFYAKERTRYEGITREARP